MTEFSAQVALGEGPNPGGAVALHARRTAPVLDLRL